MGKVIDIVLGQGGAYPFKNDSEQKNIWKKSQMEAMRKLDIEDKYNLEAVAIAMEYNKKTTGVKLQNFGVGSAYEVMMNVGILLASLSDAEFEQMLRTRKHRERFDPRTCAQD